MEKLLIIALLLGTVSCANRKAVSDQQVMATEPFIIYMTKADYSNHVPVILDDDKKTIVSYPGPGDLKRGDELLVPTRLDNGYLIDNRGISPNVAFTSFTYNEYSKLEEAPSISDLFESIIDADPIVEMYNCRSQLAVKRDIDKVNKLVRKGFKGCEKIK
jgi:hypothetical protein